MEFFGGFDEGVEFALAGFLGGHVVADLNKLLDLCAAAGHEIDLLIVAGAVVKKCVARFVATAQKLHEYLIF